MSQKRSWRPQRRRRAAQAELKLRRFQTFKRLRDALPSNAPASVRNSVNQRFSKAQRSLDRFVAGQGGREGELLGEFTRGLGKASQGVVGLAVATYGAARGLEAIGRSLSGVSGQHASAAAQLDVSRIRRDIQVGQATGTSYQNMMRKLNDFEKEFLPLRIALTNAAQNLVGNGMEILKTVTNYAKQAIPLLGAIAKTNAKFDDLYGKPPPIDPVTKQLNMDAIRRLTANWNPPAVPQRPQKKGGK